MDYQRIPQQALYWQVPGYKRTRSTKSQLEERSQQRPTKDGVHLGRRQRWQLLTDMDGVGVWPNVFSWIRAESRSRSLIGLYVYTPLRSEKCC